MRSGFRKAHFDSSSSNFEPHKRIAAVHQQAAVEASDGQSGGRLFERRDDQLIIVRKLFALNEVARRAMIQRHRVDV